MLGERKSDKKYRTFKESAEIERKHISDLIDAMVRKDNVKFERFNSTKEQQKYGDFMLSVNRKEYRVEAKVDVSKFDTVFLEIFSGRNFDHFRNGWMLRLYNYDIIAYYQVKCNRALIFDVEELHNWAFVDGHIFRFPYRGALNNGVSTPTGFSVPVSEFESKLKQFKIIKV